MKKFKFRRAARPSIVVETDHGREAAADAAQTLSRVQSRFGQESDEVQKIVIRLAAMGFVITLQ